MPGEGKYTVVILDEHPPDDGRIERHVRFLLKSGRRTVRLNFDPYVRAPEQGPFSLWGEEGFRIRGFRFRSSILNKLTLNTLSVHFILFFFRAKDVLRALAMDTRAPVILHIHDPQLLATGFLLKTFVFPGSRIIYDRHEVYERFQGGEGKIPSLERFYEIVFCGTVNGAISISDEYLPSLRCYFPRAAAGTVPNFPEAGEVSEELVREKINHCSPEEPFRLIYIGSLNLRYDRDLPLLARIADRILSRFPNASICIGGNPWGCEEEIGRLFQPLQDRFPDRFQYLGPVAHAEVLPQTTRAHLGFYLIRPDSTYWVKSSPNKIFEYLLCGVIPVVRVNIEYLDELAPCSLAFARETPDEEILGQVEALVADPRRCRQMMEAAWALSRRFTFASVAGRYLDMYDRVFR
jgi:glycosyltransferase involved in cell wall biosynthesis